ncbi:MAG: hypothetical protein ACKV2T_36750 [Kofleriaceae bacterium]
MKSLSAIPFVLVVAACGGSDLDPGAGDDPGQGTSTLAVEANVSANARVDNARNAGEFDTEMTVRITKNGADVTTGTVTMTSASGTVTLMFDTTEDRNRWRAIAAGYEEVYLLDIESGEDNLTGVRVDGPDIHTFTSPAPRAEIDSTVALVVTWSRDDQADSASIRAEEIDDISMPDSGSYMLAANSLKAKREETEENELRIRRTNRVTPEGAAGGSVMSITVDNRMTVVAAPNPAL